METDKALCMYDVKSSTNMAIAYEVKQNYVFHKNILLSLAARDNSQPSTVLLFTNNLLCDLRNTFCSILLEQFLILGIILMPYLEKYQRVIKVYINVHSAVLVFILDRQMNIVKTRCTNIYLFPSNVIHCPILEQVVNADVLSVSHTSARDTK